MDETKIVEELKKKGYRVYKPGPKKEEFKPFKAIRFEYREGPTEVEVIRESRKFAWVKSSYGEQDVKKEEIFKLDPKALKLWADAENNADALREQAEKLTDNANEIEAEAGDKVREMLKPVYEKVGT